MPDKSASLATDRLIKAYRDERKRIDTQGITSRWAAVAYLVDSSSAAHAALVARHDNPGATAKLAEFRDALSREDMIRKANTARKTIVPLIFAATGLSAVVVLGLGISVITQAVDQGKDVVAAGGGISLLIGIVSAVGQVVSEMTSSRSQTTEDRLRASEEQFYEVIGAPRPALDRMDLVRLVPPLIQILFGLAFVLFVYGGILIWMDGLPTSP